MRLGCGGVLEELMRNADDVIAAFTAPTPTIVRVVVVVIVEVAVAVVDVVFVAVAVVEVAKGEAFFGGGGGGRRGVSGGRIGERESLQSDRIEKGSTSRHTD